MGVGVVLDVHTAVRMHNLSSLPWFCLDKTRCFNIDKIAAASCLSHRCFISVWLLHYSFDYRMEAKTVLSWQKNHRTNTKTKSFVSYKNLTF